MPSAAAKNGLLLAVANVASPIVERIQSSQQSRNLSSEMDRRLPGLPDGRNQTRNGNDKEAVYTAATGMHVSGTFLRWSLTNTMIQELR